MPKIVDHDQRRHEITEAAARLIERGGLEAVTMRDVAAESGWTTGVLAHYFNGKAELLLSTFHASLAQRSSARAHGGSGDPLISALEAALPLDADRRRHWTVAVAFCSHATGDEQLATAQRNAYRTFCERVTELCGSSELAERLIAAVDGIALQALFDPQAWPPQRQREQLTAMVEVLSSDRASAR